MKAIFFTIALISLLQYSQASDYKPISSQVFTNSTLYQDLFQIGFEYTLQKAVFGDSNQSLINTDWEPSNPTVAIKIQNGVTYLRCKAVAVATDLYNHNLQANFTFVVHYKRSTGEVGVNDYKWTPILPFGPYIDCERCFTMISAPSASNPSIVFNYGLKNAISKAIADHKLPRSTYRVGEVFSAWNNQEYGYIFSVLRADNYTYRVKMTISSDLYLWGSDQELLDSLSLYSYEIEPK